MKRRANYFRRRTRRSCARSRRKSTGASDYPHVITQAHVNGPTGAGCYGAWHQLYSTAYGEVMPCDFTPLSFGNVRTQPLREIWDKMTSHPAYCQRSPHCRMQDRDFRRQWIDRIPASGPFPYPMELLGEPEVPVPLSVASQVAGCAPG